MHSGVFDLQRCRASPNQQRRTELNRRGEDADEDRAGELEDQEANVKEGHAIAELGGGQSQLVRHASHGCIADISTVLFCSAEISLLVSLSLYVHIVNSETDRKPASLASAARK